MSFKFALLLSAAAATGLREALLAHIATPARAQAAAQTLKAATPLTPASGVTLHRTRLRS